MLMLIEIIYAIISVLELKRRAWLEKKEESSHSAGGGRGGLWHKLQTLSHLGSENPPRPAGTQQEQSSNQPFLPSLGWLSLPLPWAGSDFTVPLWGQVMCAIKGQARTRDRNCMESRAAGRELPMGFSSLQDFHRCGGGGCVEENLQGQTEYLSGML